MIELSFPGKLFVIGEYAAVVSGHTSVIAAVDRYITVQCRACDVLKVESKHGLIEDDLTIQKNDAMRYVKQAIMVAQDYANQKGPFALVIKSSLESDDKKIGFGSSGVVVVAVIASVLTHYHIPYQQEVLFKLAVLVQKRLGALSSGGDIASSIYGGLIAYTRYDVAWLMCQEDNVDIVNKPWPLLAIEPLDATFLKLAIGWTTSENKTLPFVARFEQFGLAHPALYQEWLEASRRSVDMFILGIKTRDQAGCNQALEAYRLWMKMVQASVEIPIETPKLSALIECANDLGFVAKVSGSGGGDCGIACYYHEIFENLEKLRLSWAKHDILLLNVEVLKS